MSSKVIITGKHSQDNIERFRKLPSASELLTSVLTIPKEVSLFSILTSSEIGLVKAGQPQPESIKEYFCCNICPRSRSRN